MAILDSKGKVMSDAAIKREIMRVRGWASKQYDREYDKLRNRVRNYELTAGVKVEEKWRVNELLFKMSKSQKRYGAKYRGSNLVQDILATPSTGTGVVQRKGLSQEAVGRLIERLEERTFKGIIKKDKTSKELLAAAKEAGTPEAYGKLLSGLKSRVAELKTVKGDNEFTPRWFYE